MFESFVLKLPFVWVCAPISSIQKVLIFYSQSVGTGHGNINSKIDENCVSLFSVQKMQRRLKHFNHYRYLALPLFASQAGKYNKINLKNTQDKMIAKRVKVISILK